MSRYGEKHVIARGVILWDGITRPEQKDDGKGGKRTQYSLKVALLQTAPEVAEISAIATDALNADTTFKGRLPAGGCWPILPVDAQDFEGRLPSHVAFNAKTYRTPQVFDINKQEIAPMIYQNMLYAGCIVDVLVSAFAFSNVSKGIALSLDGIMIVDATAPRLPVGGVDAAAAFGGAPLPGGPTPVVTGQYVAPGGGYQPPVGGYQPSAAAPPVYQPPAAPQGYAPPAATPPPVYQPPAAQPLLAGVQPAPDFLNPPVGSMGVTPPVLGGPPAPPAPVKQMTAKAAGPYEAYVQAGWSDAQLIQEGLMVG